MHMYTNNYITLGMVRNAIGNLNNLSEEESDQVCVENETLSMLFGQKKY